MAVACSRHGASYPQPLLTPSFCSLLLTMLSSLQLEQTGDMHVAVYDWNNLFMYVSNAGLSDANGNAQPAYDRPFLRFDMGALWNTTLADY